MAALEARFAIETRRLARLGLHAAEVRRRLRPLGMELGLPVPGYTAVLEIVQRERRPVAADAPSEGGVLTALLAGRAPTIAQVAATQARARVHKDELLRSAAVARDERRLRREQPS